MRKILILIGTLTGALLAGNCRAAATLPETPSGISVQVSTNGDYEIRSHEPAWAFGGSIPFFDTMIGRHGALWLEAKPSEIFDASEGQPIKHRIE